jgi:hypothetical protein
MGIGKAMEYQFNLLADYRQLYLQDDGGPMDFTHWTRQAVEHLLLVSPHGIAVGTVRNMMVPLTIDVRETAPDDDLSNWDHVAECSFEVASGRIIVLGCTDDIVTASRISVEPGTYRARVYGGGFATLSANGLEGDDRYRVVLWPGPRRDAVVLKRWVQGAATGSTAP